MTTETLTVRVVEGAVLVTEDGSVYPGDTLDLDPSNAASLVESGVAEYVDAPATQPKPRRSKPKPVE